MAVVLQLGVLAGSAQTNLYLFSGSEANITLNPGTYIITAYGAPGANPSLILAPLGGWAGSGAEMSAEFNFSTSTTITLLVGGSGDPAYSAGLSSAGGGGGGGSFVVQGSTPLVIAGGGGGGGIPNYPGGNGNVSTNGGGGAAGGGTGGTGGGGGGGGGGSIIDSSAIAILAEVSGILSPDESTNGEIIITAVPTPLLITKDAAFGFTNGVFGFNVIGPAGSNVVIQASADLQTWIPLQTTLLGSGPFYFSDPQSPTNVQRLYRAAYAFTVGGTLTGLPAGDTVTLQDNGSDNLRLSTNGTFTFPTALPNGHTYSVTISGTSGATPPNITLMNGSGTISGANVTNVAVQCTRCPASTGNMDLDMYNAAVSDGTAIGGVPAVMVTTFGGPFRVTARGFCSDSVAERYSGQCKVTIIEGTTSCSSTTLPSGATVIQFGGALVCGPGPYGY